MRAVPVLAALMAGSSLCLATGAAGQDACDLLQSRSSAVQLTRDGFFNYISEPVFGCAGGVVIQADSAVLDDVSGFTRFIGNFEYRDSTAVMTADLADHFASEGRLIGVGNVYINDEATGAVFEGDSTVLVGSGSRREEGELTITGLEGRRAHAVILVSPREAAPDSSEIENQADAEEAANDSTRTADSAPAESDSAVAESDSTSAGPDSATPEPDSDAAESDSTAGVSDSANAEPDSRTTESDSTVAESDSTARESEEPTPPADSAAAPAANPPPRDTTPVPYFVDAQHIHMQGVGQMWATGDAELYNDDFRALADSIEYREESGRLFLRGTAPRVRGYGTEYVLSGSAIDMDLDGNQVTARGDADLSGSEINLTAPEIRVLMREGALDRIVAMNERPPEPEVPEPSGDEVIVPGDSAAVVAAEAALAPDSAGDTGAPAGETAAGSGAGPGEEGAGDAATEAAGLLTGEATPIGEEPALTDANALGTTPGETGDSTEVVPPARPRAVAETFELEGDSIDVRAPNEVLERVVAVGSARGESFARDSLNNEQTPDIARSDWVSGDTIIAVFRPAAPSGTSSDAGAEPAAGEEGGGYQLDRLDAFGEAATLYRMTPSGDSGADAGEDDTEEEGEEGGAGDEAGTAQQTPAEEVPASDVPEQPEQQAVEEEVALQEAAGDPAQPGAADEGPDALQTAEETPEEEAPEAEPETRLALHYVRGDRITIFMEDGEVTSVIVAGDARGVQLEPVAAAPPPPDTTAAPPSNRR